MENAKPAATQTPVRKTWIEPAIRTLDVGETSAAPNLGADVRGNAFPDSQFS